MESIGLYVKELRKNKKFTVEEISELTKIRKKYLEYIEDDNFSAFASIGYARATLASYVKFLKGDINKVIFFFDNKYGDRTNVNYLVNSYNSKENEKKYLLSTQMIAYTLLLILVIVLGGITWHFAKSGMLSSPFKSINKNIGKKEISEKIKSKIAIKDTLLKKSIEEELSKDKIKINLKAFDDTTDYVNQLLFSNKKNPLNYKILKTELDGS